MTASTSSAGPERRARWRPTPPPPGGNGSGSFWRVSDAGPEPPPPPPPPNLAPPPGYAAYQPSPSTSVGGLKRVRGLRTAMIVLLGVFVVGTIIQVVGLPTVVDSAKDLQSGAIEADEFLDDVDTYNVSGLLTGLSQLALIVITIIWLFRIARNHQGLGRRLTWGPGWAIGGWFLPPILYVLPFLMLRESWKAADPDVPPGDDRWKSSPDTPLLWIWGLLYIVVPIVFIAVGLRQQFSAIGSDASDVADLFADRLGLLVVQSIAGILAAVAWGLLVRALTDRHTALTGEAGAR